MQYRVGQVFNGGGTDKVMIIETHENHIRYVVMEEGIIQLDDTGTLVGKAVFDRWVKEGALVFPKWELIKDILDNL